MFGDVFDVLGDLFGTYGGRDVSDDRRAFEAYRDAWKVRDAAQNSHDPLIQELKAHNVPGAYTNPEESAALTLYFRSWSDGISPDLVKEERRRRRKQDRKWKRRRKIAE